MATDKKKLLLLFDRPQEPTFVTKGNNSVFDVPINYLPEKYKPIGVQLFNRFGEDASERISVKEIPPPNLDDIPELQRNENFSLFIPKHRKIAGKLIRLFLAAKNVDELLSTAVYARDRNIDLPSLIHVFPDKYVDSQVFARLVKKPTSFQKDQRMKNIALPTSAKILDLISTTALAFDISFRWPLEKSSFRIDEGRCFIIRTNKIPARYNFERLCNSLKRVKKLSNMREPIPEGYFPKLDSLVASRTWPSRPVNETPSDVNREIDQIRVNIDDLDRWRDRIFDAVHSGNIGNGQKIPLTEFEGIDLLGECCRSEYYYTKQEFLWGLSTIWDMSC
ncbi:hypothetical protein Zmor_001288 [Zophobas morio]|uniref:Uncharacterized protein n=1 Tax=Zophobas morio TaxID=2755281 RepID=A0AA38J6R2_9CUCU|nr:hypothetical protein Zmor_001288 [Zophobas morio]